MIPGWLPKVAVFGRLRLICRSFELDGHLAVGARALPVGSISGCQTLVQEYTAQKQILLSLAAGLESEFLDLGTRLRDILRKSKAVQKECGGVNKLLSEQGDGAAIQFSLQLLKKAEDLVMASHDHYAFVLEVFKKLASELREIESRQKQLRCTLRPLPLISIQFRIQASALDAVTREAFLNLTSEINTLSQEVEQAVERQFQELAQVQATSCWLMAELSETIALHHEKISLSLQSCRNQLATMGQALCQCDEVSRDLSSQSAGIQKGVNLVIMALQCQDSTCQKIQHVGQAIDEMVSHLQAASSPSSQPEMEGDVRQFLARANVIQLSQVEAVFTQLQDAAGQISKGIEGVEKQANALTGQTLTLGKNAVESSVVERSILGMRDILTIVTSCVFNVHRVGVALEPLKSKFIQCREQISVLAHRVRMAALNAQIYAIGVEQGAALEVLAEQTRGISDLILSDVSIIADQLRDLSAAVEDMRQRLVDFCQLSRQEEILLIEEVKLAESKLEQVRIELPRHLEMICPLQKELIVLTQQATASISFPARIAHVSSVSLGFFQRHAQMDGSTTHLTNDSQLIDQRLNQLRQNYTMAHEHEVHEEVTNSVSAEQGDKEVLLDGNQAKVSARSELDPARKGGDLGANIELF